METEIGTTSASNSASTFGLFLNLKDLEKAVSRLKKAGFYREDISILGPQKEGARNFVYRHRMNVVQGAIIGAIIGFFVIGCIGFMMGYSGFAAFKNAADNVVNYNSRAWAYSGVIGGIIGIIFGGAAGALVGIGSPYSAAKRYGFYLKEGGIILSVHLKNEVERERANDILEKCKAQDITDLNESEIWHTIVPEKNKLHFNN